MSMANRKGRKDNKNVTVSTTKDRNEIEALASKLKEQYDHLMSKLDNVTENKIVKNIHMCLSIVWTTLWVGQTQLKGNHSLKKYNGKLLHAKKDGRKRSSKKKVSSQNTTGVKYIKNLSEKKH